MKRQFIFAIPIFFLCLFACKSDKDCHSEHRIPVENPTDEETKLYTSCIQIHDEVMPRMSEISRLRTQLKSTKDQLPQGTDAEILGSINQKLSDLNKAENMMFDWMARFKEIENTQRENVDATLYSLERSAIKMRDFFDQAIESAKEPVTP